MNVLSLFDGMSCGQIALNRIGIKPSKYYAAEVDKYAIKVTQANYPDTAQLGDVSQFREWDIDWSQIDLLIGGSPCQGFSFAGKQLAFDDPRSKLFFVYVDILTHIRKHNQRIKFMLENVRMKKEHLDVITEQLGVEPVFINSALVSAQNRQRFYWCNWTVEQPKDKGVLLADIIEEAVTDREKSYCIDANYYKGATPEQYLKKSRRQLVMSCEKKGGGHIATNDSGKAYTLRTDATNGGKAMIMQRGRGANKGGIKAQDGKTPSLTANSWEQNNHLTDGMEYRKLTPTECERLQTVPDNYTNHVSNTQRYKMLGNGWTVDVIAHILKGLIYAP